MIMRFSNTCDEYVLRLLEKRTSSLKKTIFVVKTILFKKLLILKKEKTE